MSMSNSYHRSPKRNISINIRVCMALNFVRKLNNNITSKTYKNYNKVWKSSPGVFCWVFWRPFWAVYLSPSRCTCSTLYYVNEKVGRLKSNLNGIWPVILRSALRKSHYNLLETQARAYLPHHMPRRMICGTSWTTHSPRNSFIETQTVV